MACNTPTEKAATTSEKSAAPSTEAPAAKPSKKKPKKASFEKLTYKNAAQQLKALAQEHPETMVEISTEYGNITLRLFEETPLHRTNFIRLVKAGYYDQTQFYRVVKEFMIQGGNSDDLEIQSVKGKLGIYQITAEINPKFSLRRGAVAMARVRENNPKKKSAPYSFYIVQGKKYTPGELRGVEETYELKFNAEQTEVYTTVGGAPYLDYDHTVFGEVVEGMDVVDKIAEVETDKREWPLQLIHTKMKVLR
ncbi:MAG: peptidylprolyl isomerase [Salibacteraceae bacterium]